ncbi:MAG: 16S rRNA (guanine(527)-N(7))-methyltransferase RsmG [Clostridiales bacterium]|nr:16S rRNA (guanine(527)-N(7))-methyltransferase RsmG [Clostridiales bacterium]
MEEFKREFEKYLEKMSISLNKEQYDQFYTYMVLLIEWNEKINLTAITEPQEIILKHFVDSLTIAKYIEEGKTIIDMGTGAGFPGIPLKIYRNDVKVVLADSLNKRIKFLNEAIEKLQLKNIETIHCRAEELGKNKEYREKFDYATSRAVANLSTLSEYLLPFVKLNGSGIFMKTMEIDEELENAKKAIKILGGRIEKVDKFEIPESDLGRSIIIVKKEKQTPSKYPRKPGTPAKEPL